MAQNNPQESQEISDVHGDKFARYFSFLSDSFVPDLQTLEHKQYPAMIVQNSYKNDIVTCMLSELRLDIQQQTLNDGYILGFKKNQVTLDEQLGKLLFKIRSQMQFFTDDLMQKYGIAKDAINPYAFQKLILFSEYSELFYYNAFIELKNTMKQFKINEPNMSTFRVATLLMDTHHNEDSINNAIDFALNRYEFVQFSPSTELPIEVFNFKIVQRDSSVVVSFLGQSGVNNQQVSAQYNQLGIQQRNQEVTQLMSLRNRQYYMGKHGKWYKEMYLVNSPLSESRSVEQISETFKGFSSGQGVKLLIVECRGGRSGRPGLFEQVDVELGRLAQGLTVVCSDGVLHDLGTAVLLTGPLHSCLASQLLQIVNSLFFTDITIAKPFSREIDSNIHMLILKSKRKNKAAQTKDGRLKIFQHFLQNFSQQLIQHTIPPSLTEPFTYLTSLFPENKIDQQLLHYLRTRNNAIVSLQVSLELHRIYHIVLALKAEQQQENELDTLTGQSNFLQIEQDFREFLKEWCLYKNIDFNQIEEQIKLQDAKTLSQVGSLYPSQSLRDHIWATFKKLTSNQQLLGNDFIFDLILPNGKPYKPVNRWSETELGRQQYLTEKIITKGEEARKIMLEKQRGQDGDFLRTRNSKQYDNLEKNSYKSEQHYQRSQPAERNKNYKENKIKEEKYGQQAFPSQMIMQPGAWGAVDTVNERIDDMEDKENKE